ncbi:MAG: hypothetical protein ACRD6W_16960, partial [Nitrososphaerales archaeon]
SNLLNPTGPKSTAPAPPVPAAPSPAPAGDELNGSLVIFVTSNQNTTNRLAPPTNTSSAAEGVPVVATFNEAVNFSQPQHLWTTNANGLAGCIECLPVGLYVVSVQYDGLEITTSASVFVGEQTLVRVSFTGRLYDLTYSAESGVLVTPSSAQYTMFANLNSPVAVANVGQPVSLNVLEGASGAAGYSVNATVVSQGAPTTGTQWLLLGTLSPVDLVDATSISMTAWTPSTTTTVGPVTYSQGSLTPVGSRGLLG